MGILGAIIIGFIAGIIAKLVTPGGPSREGFILTTVLGIVGARAGHLPGPGDRALPAGRDGRLLRRRSSGRSSSC